MRNPIIEQALERFEETGRDEEAIRCLLRDPPLYEPTDLRKYQERYMRIKMNKSKRRK